MNESLEDNKTKNSAKKIIVLDTSSEANPKSIKDE